MQAGAKEEEEQLVTFRVGQAEFAIEIERVQEIIRTTEITPVPQAPSYVLGVLSLRNHLLPIIDLRARFGLAESQQGAGAGRRKRSRQERRHF